jgi:protein AFG1
MIGSLLINRTTFRLSKLAIHLFVASLVPSISLIPRQFYRLLNPNANRVLSVPESEVPRGLYLYGDVGTGKSMLMDLFYSTLPANITRKRRVHFHAFMIDVHKRLHALKVREGDTGIEDPILLVSRELANEANVLCLDEFQVTDIVDAMILRRLMECLLQFGVVCVMTSK